jgi:predicted restriction endonuclease
MSAPRLHNTWKLAQAAKDFERFSPARMAEKKFQRGFRIAGELDRKEIIKKLDRLWAEAVKERAGHACERCGKTTDLQAHHIASRRYIGTRWSVDNGLCLCRACHLYFFHKDSLGAADWLDENLIPSRLQTIRINAHSVAKFSTGELKLLADNWKSEKNNTCKITGLPVKGINR